MSKGKTHHVALAALLNVYGQILLGKKGLFWGLLGGHIESSDKGREKTIAREIREESKLEGVFEQQLIFSCDEQRSGQLYLFDIFVGYHYGENPPAPLLKEGILEVKWFSFDEAKKLKLTRVAQKAIDFLEKKTDRSFMSECLHHFQVVVNLAQSRQISREVMSALIWSFGKSANILQMVSSESIPKKKKTDHEQKTILFVEDHREILGTFSENFKFFGYLVYAFSNPEKALEWLKNSVVEINALVTDYEMPGIDGAEFIRKAKPHLNASTRIVLLSGKNVPEEEKEGVIFFGKPVSAVEIIQAIQGIQGKDTAL